MPKRDMSSIVGLELQRQTRVEIMIRAAKEDEGSKEETNWGKGNHGSHEQRRKTRAARGLQA